MYEHSGYGSSDIDNVEIFVSESLWKFLEDSVRFSN